MKSRTATKAAKPATIKPTADKRVVTIKLPLEIAEATAKLAKRERTSIDDIIASRMVVATKNVELSPADFRRLAREARSNQLFPPLPSVTIHRDTHARLEAASESAGMGPNRMADLLLEYALGQWEAGALKIAPAPMPMERGEG